MKTIKRLTFQLWNKILKFCNFCQMSSYVLAGLMSCFVLPIIHSSSCNRNMRILQKLQDRSVYTCHCEKPVLQTHESLKIWTWTTSSLLVKCKSSEQNFACGRTLYWFKTCSQGCINHRERGHLLRSQMLCRLGLSLKTGHSMGGLAKMNTHATLWPGSKHKITYWHICRW